MSSITNLEKCDNDKSFNLGVMLSFCTGFRQVYIKPENITLAEQEPRKF